ncbi:MAG: sugar ABC transporter permease [Spirochaetales bacterium]|nr:sugar ABC transporter permease [Spirochaetales bacterium]
MTKTEKRNLRNGLIFVSPWIVGFLCLQVYPILYSLRLSFTRYSGFGKPVSVGLENFRTLIQDPLFTKSLYNTFFYTVWAVPLGVVVAILIALAMNQRVREVAVYRAILYLPSILPLFALSFVWIVFSNPRFGLLNYILQGLGLPIIDFIGNPVWTKPSIVLLAQLGAGGPALIFLAGLRGIPRELYESAEIDGAGAMRSFWSITLPMLTPVILYDIILGLSMGLQVFTQAYIITSGGVNMAGPNNSLLFYVFYIYKNAFQYTRMGYASALVWVLFVISMILALSVFKWARSWVHYGNE